MIKWIPCQAHLKHNVKLHAACIRNRLLPQHFSIISPVSQWLRNVTPIDMVVCVLSVFVGFGKGDGAGSVCEFFKSNLFMRQKCLSVCLLSIGQNSKPLNGNFVG